MVFDTREFSPVVFRGTTMAPKDSYEYEEWWLEQLKRCLYGYSVNGVKITGPHYWYLNFWKIRGINRLVNPNQVAKRLVPPRFLQLDYDFFWEWDRAKREKKDICIAKKRQCGFSEKVSSICGHEFTLMPASQILIVAGEEKYAKNTTRFVHRGLDALHGTPFFKRRTPNSLDETISRFMVYEDDGSAHWDGDMSELYMLSAKNNPEVASRFSPSLVVYEETGHFEGLIRTRGYVVPSIEADGGEKTGWQIFLGTGGEMGKGTEDAAKIFYNPSDFNCLEYENIYSDDPDKKKICYFVPGWRYYIVDKHGIDDVEAGKKKMKENREAAVKSSDPDAIVKEAIARPENPDEIYMITGNNRFPVMLLNQQRNKIFRSKTLSNLATRGFVMPVYDNIPTPTMPQGMIKDVRWVPNKDGDVILIDPPQKDKSGKPLEIYYGGTDSYDRDEAPTSNSFLSTSIIDGMRNMYVARLTVRPKKAEEAYLKSALVCMLYGCRNLIEYSNLRIFDWYIRSGLEYMLKERPMLAYANVIKTTAVNKYGIDPITRDSWLSLYNSYMQDHVDKMFDVDQITRAILWRDDIPKYNCDITISSALARLHQMDEVEYQEEQKDPEEQRELFGYQLKAGIMQQS